jgi:hypothetical protein
MAIACLDHCLRLDVPSTAFRFDSFSAEALIFLKKTVLPIGVLSLRLLKHVAHASGTEPTSEPGKAPADDWFRWNLAMLKGQFIGWGTTNYVLTDSRLECLLSFTVPGRIAAGWSKS